MTGLLVLAAVLVAATAFGVWRRWSDGRIGRVGSLGGVAGARRRRRDTVRLGPAELGGDLGARATLVQFSTAFCAPCRVARQVLGRTATSVAGVRHLEIDAESHLELVRRLGITRTPTTFVLDAEGRVIRRVSGVPRAAEVRAVLDTVLTS